MTKTLLLHNRCLNAGLKHDFEFTRGVTNYGECAY